MPDEISLAAYREAMAAELRRAFASWVLIPPGVWAEEVRRMKNGARFKFAFAPYLRKPFQSFFERNVVETVLAMFSRAGKSEIVLNAIGWCIDQQPRRILSLWPTNSNAEKWSKDNLTGELFDETPCLHHLGGKTGKRNASNTILHKSFPGGLIDIFGANAPGDMRRAKGNLLYGEEIDAIGEEMTDEGDQLAIFNKRGDEFPDTIRIFASYPALRGKSRIWSKLEESDFQQYFTTCVICGGEPYVMKRDQIVYERDKPELARLQCPKCKEYLNDEQRYCMMMQGLDNDCWIPTKPFRGKRGFQANAMLWPHEVDPKKYPGGFLQMIAQAEIDCEKSDNPERSRRVIVNTVDAEPFDPTGESEKSPEWEPIFNRREDYATDKKVVVPRPAMVITAAADLHKNRIEVKWEGWGENEENWTLQKTILPGEIQDGAVWKDFEREMNREFVHETGAKIGLALAFVDAGKWPDWVYRFFQDLARRGSLTGKIRAIRGSPTFPHPVIATKYGSIAKNLKGHWVGVDEAKDLIYTRLRLPNNSTAGFRHYPITYGEQDFNQLVSEQVKITYGKTGEEERRYRNDQHLRNEELDLSVYNLAAYRLYAGLRIRAGFWEERLKELEKSVAPESEQKEEEETNVVVWGRGFNV